MHYFLNIGSNLGNTALNISRAVRRIEEAFGYFEISHTVESEPFGFDSTNLFRNVGLMIISDKRPEEVLRILQEIEKGISPASHRGADGGYVDRVIDIDIVAADEVVVDTPELRIPHPGLAERRFFLEPMAELAPGWRHPQTGQTPAEMLALLPAAPEN